jgi:hypothetical protein
MLQCPEAIGNLVRPLLRALEAHTFADALRVTCDDLTMLLGATSVSVTGPGPKGNQPHQGGMLLPLEGERTQLGTMLL